MSTIQIYGYKEGSYWVYEAKAFGLLTSDPDRERAKVDMEAAIRCQVAYALKHDNELEHLFRDREMPAADVENLANCINCGTTTTLKFVTIERHDISWRDARMGPQ